MGASLSGLPLYGTTSKVKEPEPREPSREPKAISRVQMAKEIRKVGATNTIR